MNTNSISVIVPAYNEEKGIAHVLKSLSKCHVDEIIVVNDGSTDDTLNIIRQFDKHILINLKKNHGKGYAISTGIKKAKGDIVIFIDADLIGLNNEHIVKLTQPIIENKKDVVIGYPDLLSIDKLFLPLSGERSYRKKDLTPYLNAIAKKGYGLELYLNYLFRNKKIMIFPLTGIRAALKYEKQNYDTVAKLFLIESFDILSEILKQKNPVSYLIKSYFYSFYFRKPEIKNNQIDRLTKYIKKNIINKIT